MCVRKEGAWSVMKKYTVVLRHMCIFPFDITEKALVRSKLRQAGGITLLMFLGFFVLLGIYKSYESETPVFKILGAFMYVSLFTSTLIFYLRLSFNKSLFIQLSSSLERVGLFLKKFQTWEFSYDYLEEVGILIIIFALIAEEIYYLERHFVITIAENVNHFLVLVITLSFKRFALYLTNGYMCLKNMLSTPERYDILALVSNLERLNFCSAQLNILYDIPIFLICSTAFFITTIKCYLLYEAFFGKEAHPYASNILLVALYFYAVNNIVNPSCLIYEKTKRFNSVLYQLMIDDKSTEIANNKKLKLHIAMNREIVFTAYGFFTLDYSLIHSMIAAATTYLVILIQFGQPSSPLAATIGTPINQSNISIENVTKY